MIFTQQNKTLKAKDRIADALAILIKEKYIGDITVSELAAAAGVGKSSFYRNYRDIYDVLEYISDGFVNRVCDILFALVFEYSVIDFTEIPETVDYRVIIKLFGLKESDTILVNYLFRVHDSKVFRSVVNLFVEKVGQYASANGLDVEAVRFCTRFVTNGIYFSALTDYFENDKFDASLLEMLKYFDITEFK